MEYLRTFFPFSFRENDTKTLIITIIGYIVVICLLGLVLGLLGKIPLVGWIFRLTRWLVNLYCSAGIILAILKYLNIVQ